MVETMIKFRGWNKKTKQMISPGPLRWLEEVVVNPENGLPEILNNAGLAHAKDFILMQFTGVKDKDEKEIYQGDIIEYKEHINRIVFRYGCFGFKTLSRGTYKGGFYQLGRLNMKQAKVIGNIFENEDLISKDEIDNDEDTCNIDLHNLQDKN